MLTIAELRARNGKMTQAKLAKEIGVDANSVCRWEKNIYTISAENLVKLCRYFNVKADELLGINKKFSA